MIDSWTWGDQPETDQLEHCLNLLCQEQQKLCNDAAGTTLYSYRFRQRSTVLKRYYIAQCRNSQKSGASIPDSEDHANLEIKKKEQSKIQGTQGLARLGSRAALSFAFAFLRRAWRSGEDGDLCTDLLEETLDALRLLPPASLFDESTVSSVWLEVVERTSKFLRSVVQGQMDSIEVPLKDRHTALTLLLELALQRGSLHELLKMVKLLLDLWSLGQRSRQDNRAGLRDSCAPIIPFLKRFEEIEQVLEEDQDDDLEDYTATQSFLRYLEYPPDPSVNIDLEQAAVIIMSHLDRLAQKYQPNSPVGLLQDHESRQKVLWSGQVSWTPEETLENGNFGVSGLLRNLRFRTLVTTHRGLLGLDSEGGLFFVSYLEPKVQFCKTDLAFEDLFASVDGLFVCGVSGPYLVFWDLDQNSPVDQGPSETYKLGLQVQKIQVGKGHCIILTEQGEVFIWTPKSTSGPLETPTTLKGVTIVDVACGGTVAGMGDAFYLALSDTGLVYSWGDGDFGKLGRGGSDCSKTPRIVDKLQGLNVDKV